MKYISNCEREFVRSCVANFKRLDGRERCEGRTLEIVFEKERGYCLVILGNTRVLVRVNGEITKPRPSNPKEGMIFVNFDMTSPDGQYVSRYSDEYIMPQRCLERCFQESRCVDLESLCIITGYKVWTIRVNICTVNDDGNALECASIGVLAALAHYRRPLVTISGNEFVVHPVTEKNPVPLVLHHMPICICLALFGETCGILVDPTEIEEKACDGIYIMGMNAHQEVCFVGKRGVLLLTENNIESIEIVAEKRAQEVTKIIRSALDKDAYERETNAPIGFANLVKTGKILGAKHLKIFDLSDMSNQSFDSDEDSTPCPVFQTQKESVIPQMPPSQAKTRALRILGEEAGTSVFEAGHSKWGCVSDDESSEEIEEVSEVRKSRSAVTQALNLDCDEEVSEVQPSTSAVIYLGSDEEVSEVQPSTPPVIDLESDEEEIVYLGTQQLDKKISDKRGWFSKDPFA